MIWKTCGATHRALPTKVNKMTTLQENSIATLEVLRQSDMELVKRQDYIETPNYNGYRSLHLDLRVPIYLSDRTESVLVEVQLRTVAMDFWASLEHDIRYKKDKAALPTGINEQMFACADEIADIDRKMQDMYHRIQAAE